jgi:hypothetical protein
MQGILPSICSDKLGLICLRPLQLGFVHELLLHFNCGDFSVSIALERGFYYDGESVLFL